MTRSFLVFI